MNAAVARALWLFPLGATIFLCHVSARLYEYSTLSLAIGEGAEPVSFSQLTRYAAYVATPSSLDSCINRLRQIDGAKQQWAFEHALSPTNGTLVTWQDIEPYVMHGPSGRLWCPYGGRY